MEFAAIPSSLGVGSRASVCVLWVMDCSVGEFQCRCVLVRAYKLPRFRFTRGPDRMT